MAGTAVLGRLTWQLADVVDVVTETHRVRTIGFDVPDWSGHRAGQHVDVRLTAEDGYQAHRSYSIASAPDGTRVELTVETRLQVKVNKHNRGYVPLHQTIYPGNLPGQVGEWENTRCHHCNATLIRRWGFVVQENRVGAGGTCPECCKPLPGIWGRASGHGDGRVRPIA